MFFDPERRGLSETVAQLPEASAAGSVVLVESDAPNCMEASFAYKPFAASNS